MSIFSISDAHILWELPQAGSHVKRGELQCCFSFSASSFTGNWQRATLSEYFQRLLPNTTIYASN